MALDQSSSPLTSVIPFYFLPHGNSTPMTSASLGQLHSSLTSGATGTLISSDLALPSEEIGEPIKLQLFDGTPAASGLITHHHPDIISLANAGDAQLSASLSFKPRSALTIEEVADEDCLELPNSESIHQPILVELKREESVSTPLNPPSPQAKPIPSHTTPSEQLPQPGDNTVQPQNNAILLPTPSSTSPELN
ncbi:hypothetical protein C0995_011751 [Termitomyces sp. Mi166|nr:hypothetical protein C0995_011751 [Termitomyces sp. Mi166\